MIGKKLLSNNMSPFRHATLLFTAVLLIVTNGCSGSAKVDLKDRCMKNPLQLLCRGSVMKRGVPKLRNLDMIFDDYLRSRISRTSSEWDGYPRRRWNILNKLADKERDGIYSYSVPNKQIKRPNRSKLLNSLMRSQSDEVDAAGRYARDSMDVNNPNASQPDVDFNPYLENLEYK